VPRVLGQLLTVTPEHGPLRELDALVRERVAPAFAAKAGAMR